MSDVWSDVMGFNNWKAYLPSQGFKQRRKFKSKKIEQGFKSLIENWQLTKNGPHRGFPLQFRSFDIVE